MEGVKRRRVRSQYALPVFDDVHIQHRTTPVQYHANMTLTFCLMHARDCAYAEKGHKRVDAGCIHEMELTVLLRLEGIIPTLC
jgi:hypothetical protein